MCVQPASDLGSWLLVLSNVAYLVGLYVAARYGHMHTAVLFAGVFCASTAYHLCLAQFVCLGGLECSSLRLLDNMVAFALLADVVLMLAQFDVARAWWHHAALVVALLPAWALQIDDMLRLGEIGWFGARWLAGSLAALVVIKLGVLDRGRLHWPRYIAWRLAAAAFLGGAALFLFTRDDERVSLAQDLAHTGWHLLGGLAPSFAIMALRPDARAKRV